MYYVLLHMVKATAFGPFTCRELAYAYLAENGGIECGCVKSDIAMQSAIYDNYVIAKP